MISIRAKLIENRFTIASRPESKGQKYISYDTKKYTVLNIYFKM